MAPTTTTENDPIPDTPTNSPLDRPYIEPVFTGVFRADPQTYHEVVLTFNYGPHACSTGHFHLNVRKCRTTEHWPAREKSGSLGASKPHARRSLDNYNSLLTGERLAAVRDAVEAFTPDPTQLPKWSDRHIPRPVKPDVHSTSDPAYLIDHPNLTVTDDGSLGEYTLPSADSDGVYVHRPGTSRNNTEYQVQGAGVELADVTDVIVDDEPFDYATEPQVVGMHRRFYPYATVTVEDGVARITTDNDRQWAPQI